MRYHRVVVRDGGSMAPKRSEQRPLLPSRRQRQLAIAGLATAFLLTVVMAVIGWYAHRQVSESLRWVTHTRDALRDFDLLAQAVTDAETGQRGFLLAGDARYLESYRAATASLGNRLDRLRRSSEGDATQQDRLARLEQRIDLKAAELAATVVQATGGHRDAALAVAASNRGQDLMDGIRLEIRDGIAHEQQSLEQRMRRLNDGITTRTYMTVGLVVLSAIMLGGLIAAVRRLHRLQPMVTLCAWSRTIKFENRWVTFEEYLGLRFGLQVTHGVSPEQAEKLLALKDGELLARRGAPPAQQS
jgi:CHASE3 domain sensor protein